MIQRLAATVARELQIVRCRGRGYYCPICECHYGRFLPAGVVLRPNALCPQCGSLERHRLLWVTLHNLWKRGVLRRQGTLLHVAPEACLASKVRNAFDYISVDLVNPSAMLRADITDAPFRDNEFDAIVCNHVLEHVPDDKKAIGEVFRILRPGGWASIQVPIQGDVTQEDLSITDPNMRARLYGQADHVRYYGRDFVQRLQSAGFSVQVIAKGDACDTELLRAISVEVEQEVVIAIKPVSGK